MRLRWFTVPVVAVFLLALTPVAAVATTLEDPDDVDRGMIDIKSASVRHAYADGQGVMALTVESYEPFGCDALSGAKSTGGSLAFVIDYPSTPRTPDLRIRVRCLSSGVYWWRARLTGPRLEVQRNTAIRPTDTTLMILFTGDWYSTYGETPARWKVVSTRWVDSEPAEVDIAPDAGWGVFDDD